MSALHELHREAEAARVLLATYTDVLADDRDARHDMVEGETNLHNALRAGLVRITEIDAIMTGIKAFAARLEDRQHRLGKQREMLRTAIATAMEIAELRKLETDIATVSLKAVPPSVVVTDEAQIPAKFFVRAEPRLDRRALLAALKGEEVIPGAALSNGGSTIQIR